MATKVTIQDIADALDLSRNTVSKALNNTGIIADATRQRIITKAIEMGYKQFSYAAFSPSASSESSRDTVEIAVFMTHGMDQSHFASPVLDKFYSELTLLGHRCSIHRVHPDEIRSLRLPPSFSKERSSGILCLEMLNAEYDQMLCGLGIPVLFIDSPLIGLAQYIQADLILMENRGSIYLFVEEMIKRGKKKIGFIGEYRHSLIFCQRYLGFRDAMYMYGLPINEDFCILGNKETGKPETPSPEEYQEYLMEQLRSRNELPEVFLCANDFVALCVLQCFKRLGISCPQDVYLCGFDDAPESRILTPTLTTIHTHSQIMAVTAAQLLLSRIKMPSLNYRIVHTETTLIYRESTGD